MDPADVESDGEVMRVLLESLMALSAVVILGLVVLWHRGASTEQAQQAYVQTSLTRLAERTAYHAAIAAAQANDRSDVEALRASRLRQIRPEWFDGDLPLNVMLEGDRPWIDLAPPGDLAEHPPDPVARRIDQAGFWYNPTLGVFRARVAPADSSGTELAIYNDVNAANLDALAYDPAPTRQPLAHDPHGHRTGILTTSASTSADPPHGHSESIAPPHAATPDEVTPPVRRTLRQRS